MGAHPGRVAIPILIVLAAIVFFTGINWGLPTRAADAFLFGDRQPWSGQQIVALAGGWEEHGDLAADAARNPLAGREQVLVLNDTDVKRAEIVRRYRLFSYQPDELITLRALAGMKPGQGKLDPKLYQYGGLWVYPVGTMLQAAGRLGLVDVRPDVAWYLDHPEAFGRFYVVARFYSAMWGLVGVIAVYGIVARIVGGWIFPAAGVLCFIFMPVVVNAAHEAKPHLAGAVLMLLAAWAAARYVEIGTRRMWVVAGALCGAAVGMVLTSVPVMLVLPGMVLLRRTPWREKVRVILCAGLVAMGVYLAANPYVGINLLWHRELLRSNLANNLANSSAMYHRGAEGSAFANGCRLIGAGMSPVLAMAGAAGVVTLGLRAARVRDRPDGDEVRRRATGVLLALPAAAGAVQFFVFAAGKQAEYARFAVLLDVFLAIEAVVAVATFCNTPLSLSLVRGREGRGEGPSGRGRFWAFRRVRTADHSGDSGGILVRSADPTDAGAYASGAPLHSAPHPNPLPRVRGRGDQKPVSVNPVPPSFKNVGVLVLLVLATAIFGLLYVRGFVRDCRPETGRIETARLLRNENERGARTLALWAEPAPYYMPPVDLFRWQMLLLPRGAQMQEQSLLADVVVRPIDYPPGGAERSVFATPMSWADKRFDVQAKPRPGTP
ncbi:MAG: hypothetical protein JWN51_1795 [Phycisphaerales bacterium]|nr:hypothetical protein [Phycisphaerales bacterium]